MGTGAHAWRGQEGTISRCGQERHHTLGSAITTVNWNSSTVGRERDKGPADGGDWGQEAVKQATQAEPALECSAYGVLASCECWERKSVL